MIIAFSNFSCINGVDGKPFMRFLGTQFFKFSGQVLTGHEAGPSNGRASYFTKIMIKKEVLKETYKQKNYCCRTKEQTCVQRLGIVQTYASSWDFNQGLPYPNLR